VSAPGIEDVVAALRTSGDTNRALAALRRRDDDLHRLSLKRLHGSARLHSYLQTHSPGAFDPPAACGGVTSRCRTPPHAAVRAEFATGV
jgi:hypothetical protein